MSTPGASRLSISSRKVLTFDGPAAALELATMAPTAGASVSATPLPHGPISQLADLLTRGMDAAVALRSQLAGGSVQWSSLSLCQQPSRAANTRRSQRSWALQHPPPQSQHHSASVANPSPIPMHPWRCMASITASAGGPPRHAVDPQRTPPQAASSSGSASGLPASSNLSVAAKAEVGRATWTLLHTLGAQFPDRPSRQQRKDACMLVDCLTRIYPCGDCARHFAELVR